MRASSFDDAAYVRAGADVIDEAVWNADVLLKINAPSDAEIAPAPAGAGGRVAARAGPDPDLVEIARGSGGHRAGDGCRAADLARPVARRAVVDGQHRWVPRGRRGGPRVRLVLHRPGDRGGEGAAGEGARRGRRRRRSGRDRHGDPRWVRWSARSTPAPRSASRWSRWARSSCASTSRRPARRPTGTRRETSADFDAKAAELYAEQAADVDIIITTALIPGRPAPRLITEAMVASMKPGSVVVDMAASNGGNVAGTVADQKVVTDNGVTILGYTDLPGRLPTQASQLFGTNLVNLLKLRHPGQGRRVRPRPRRPGAARDDRGARRRGALAAAAGAGVRGPGRRSGPGAWRRSRRRCR